MPKLLDTFALPYIVAPHGGNYIRATVGTAAPVVKVYEGNATDGVYRAYIDGFVVHRGIEYHRENVIRKISRIVNHGILDPVTNNVAKIAQRHVMELFRDTIAIIPNCGPASISRTMALTQLKGSRGKQWVADTSVNVTVWDTPVGPVIQLPKGRTVTPARKFNDTPEDVLDVLGKIIDTPAAQDYEYLCFLFSHTELTNMTDDNPATNLDEVRAAKKAEAMLPRMEEELGSLFGTALQELRGKVHEEARRMVASTREKHDLMRQKHTFASGDMVTWKPGLSNHECPPIMVVQEVLSAPVYDTSEESSSSGTPTFREPLDIIVGFEGVGHAGFVELHLDSRRLRPLDMESLYTIIDVSANSLAKALESGDAPDEAEEPRTPDEAEEPDPEGWEPKKEV